MNSPVPKAPDATDEHRRTIEFYYCPNTQAHVAYKLEDGPGDQIIRTRICRVDYRTERHCEEEIALLTSWAAVTVRYVLINGIISTHPFHMERQLLLHDTPKVRAVLKKIDSELARNLDRQLGDVLRQVREAGYTLAQFAPLSGSDSVWADLPADTNLRIYKNHE